MGVTRRELAGLTFAEWHPGGAPVVLCLHGLTSTSEVWSAFAAALPDARVIAPDLPGRGGSVDTPAGPGLAGHAEAVVRLADELALDDIVVVGHSMGAFVAPLAAYALGKRVRKVVLMDGGVPPEQTLVVRRPVVRAVFGLQTRLLDRRWRDVRSYVDAVEGKAIANRAELRPRMVEWAAYMLGGPPGALRPRVDSARLVADATDALAGEKTLPALTDVDAPVHAIVAANGKDDNAKPFISDRALAAGHVCLPRLTSERVRANHLTMLFDPAGPAAVRALP
ncbi:alpha/beta hydrolase [Actinoplanes sp. TBRC 11911]|uniref:alpha/beta fold hydrolase n=1 Tax=Actinoplanes sp. TBRC 11911 TaxID=2729386 RepID=UPI00145F500D|nr:alpha/beta hydrolase [Actinoplanes sp. TBRC 11911]NMO56091.1 alpha/beta hydrolase [Actinoplanes sp. TBRC 11911]